MLHLFTAIAILALGQDAKQDAAKIDTKVPGNLAELKALEDQVQKVVAKVSSAVVGIRVGNGSGSGVIISEDGYVLTAGHVSGPPGNDKAIIILPNGKQLKATTLGKNGGIDSGLMKITDAGKYPFLEMGKSSGLKPGQWVIAIGHPGGFRINRTPVVRVGRLSFVSNSFLQTDCTLVGGDSGGPLFDFNGDVIGIHSRISNKIEENIHVPVDTFKQTWDRLVRGETWGGDLGRPQIIQTPGGTVVFEEKGELNKKDPFDKILEASHSKVFTFKMSPGNAYTIDLVSKDFDAFLRLEDPDGKKLDDNDDGGGKTNARIVYRPSREADYKIVVASFEGSQTGKFTLTIRKADLASKDLPTGKIDVLEALKIPRPAASQILGQSAKAGVSLYAQALVLNETGNPVADRDILFLWKGGKEKAKTDDQGAVRLHLSKDRLQELVLDLPKGFRAQLQLVNGDGQPIPLKLNQGKELVKSAGGDVVLEKKGNLAATDPADPLLKSSFSQKIPIKLKADKTYTFDLASPDFDAFLRLEDGKGKKLAEDDDGAGNFNARIVYRATADMDADIIITTFEGRQTGRYTLTVREATVEKK